MKRVHQLLERVDSFLENAGRSSAGLLGDIHGHELTLALTAEDMNEAASAEVDGSVEDKLGNLRNTREQIDAKMLAVRQHARDSGVYSKVMGHKLSLRAAEGEATRVTFGNIELRSGGGTVYEGAAIGGGEVSSAQERESKAQYKIRTTQNRRADQWEAGEYLWQPEERFDDSVRDSLFNEAAAQQGETTEVARGTRISASSTRPGAATAKNARASSRKSTSTEATFTAWNQSRFANAGMLKDFTNRFHAFDENADGRARNIKL
ncbi:unnamed protein product, partial [Amoebophrya sp. A25]|eukprot:GSA25T00003203001.1